MAKNKMVSRSIYDNFNETLRGLLKLAEPQKGAGEDSSALTDL